MAPSTCPYILIMSIFKSYYTRLNCRTHDNYCIFVFSEKYVRTYKNVQVTAVFASFDLKAPKNDRLKTLKHPPKKIVAKINNNNNIWYDR